MSTCEINTMFGIYLSILPLGSLITNSSIYVMPGLNLLDRFLFCNFMIYKVYSDPSSIFINSGYTGYKNIIYQPLTVCAVGSKNEKFIRESY